MSSILKFMRSYFKHLWNSIYTIFQSIFYDDLDVMSDEARKALSNPNDAMAYKEGLKLINNGAEEVEVTFLDGSKITLVK